MVTLASQGVNTSMVDPDSKNGVPLLVSYERGGVEVNDTSEGLELQSWVATCDGTEIWTRPEAGGTRTLVTTDTNITEISFSFDQAMRPTVAYVANGLLKHYWFDTDIPGFVTTDYPGAYSPQLLLDDKRARSITLGESDNILFYLKSNDLYYRIQSERFLQEHQLTFGNIPGVGVRINKAGLDSGLRLRVEVQTRLDQNG